MRLAAEETWIMRLTLISIVLRWRVMMVIGSSLYINGDNANQIVPNANLDIHRRHVACDHNVHASGISAPRLHTSS
jgi:hypothetical protein